ncbi:MAG: thiamine phosphate synthase [Terriglobia bacterium]|jgi:thiamine-phosphate pyrophosphorylase
MKNFLLCYITDRRQLRSVSLAAVIRETVRAGVDIVQVREKDLTGRELIALVEEALSAAREPGMGGARVVVNDRVDVALAGGADGAHLAAHSMPVQVVRRFVPRAFVIGVSCHSLGEAMTAESGGADYLVLGPVFQTPSKLGYGPPLGLDKLRNITSRIRIPVLALGGITVERIRPCLEAGASGIAGIRIFQDCECVQERVRELRAQFK